jgi:hypothetical protein
MGVGKLLHMTTWTRPDIMHSVHELSQFMTGALFSHLAAMHQVMEYCVATPYHGLTMTPNDKWDGSVNKVFKVSGHADSDCAKDIGMQCSFNCWLVLLCGTWVNTKSKMMTVVALLVTEAELSAAISCVQNILFVKNILKSLGFTVELPMIVEVNNKGGKDFIDSWMVGGQMQHIQTKFHLLWELEEQGIITIKWISTDNNTADISLRISVGQHLKNMEKMNTTQTHGINLRMVCCAILKGRVLDRNVQRLMLMCQDNMYSKWELNNM